MQGHGPCTLLLLQAKCSDSSPVGSDRQKAGGIPEGHMMHTFKQKKKHTARPEQGKTLPNRALCPAQAGGLPVSLKGNIPGPRPLLCGYVGVRRWHVGKETHSLFQQRSRTEPLSSTPNPNLVIFTYIYTHAYKCKCVCIFYISILYICNIHFVCIIFTHIHSF